MNVSQTSRSKLTSKDVNAIFKKENPQSPHEQCPK
jgi:hypothetical protein